MASSSISVASGIASTAAVPKSYTARSAIMSFRCSGDDLQDPNSWRTLERLVGKDIPLDANVGPVVFDYDLAITQKTKATRCKLIWKTNDYRNPRVNRGPKEFDPITLEVECSGEKKLKSVGGTRAYNVDGVVGHLKALLTGIDSLDIANRWHQITRADYKALAIEAKAQLDSLGVFENCRIVTKQGRTRRFVTVEVYRDISEDTGDSVAVQHDEEKKIGQSYILRAPNTFPSDEDTLKECPVLGGETVGWELVVAKSREHTDAALVGTIRNSFGIRGIADFIGKEEYGVTLEPLFNDVQGDRARSSVTKHLEDLDNESKRLHGFFVNPEQLNRQKPKIPTDRLFGDWKCDAGENQLDSDIQLPDNVTAKLNDSQLEYVSKAVASKVSICQGPPGTGKSSTAAALLLYLLTVKHEKVAAVAVASGPKPFARVYSESMIFSQWAQGEFDTLNDPLHIEYLRHELAQQTPDAWGGYLLGRHELVQYGRIDSADTNKEYTKQALELTQQVLSTSQAVFCTVATCQARALYVEDMLRGQLQWYYKATSIIVDEAGTAQRPHLMIPIMAFPDAQRLALCGDPFQLPALVLAQETKRIWPACYLEKIMERNYPLVMLNVQYRMHDQLYAHLIYLTSNPSEFLQNLLERPTQFSTLHGTYILRSFLHFLDVPEGQQESFERGSSWNTAEIDVVDGLVKALLARGIARLDICVMTGYSAQRKLLWQKAKDNGWTNIKFIGSVDSSQGSQCRVVILSLVTTRGMPAFMGDRPRANVGTSRQREAVYFVGQFKFWSNVPVYKKRATVMHSIMKHMDGSSIQKDRPPFVVQRQASAPSQEITVSEDALGFERPSLTSNGPSFDPLPKPSKEIKPPTATKAKRKYKEAEQSALRG
ncbi:MAG: hypothetical protein Q9225_005861 [Loekoesia sp. 1 TL-2023]